MSVTAAPSPSLWREAAFTAFIQLHPKAMQKNPVMFVVEGATVVVSLLWLRDLVWTTAGSEPLWFSSAIVFFLWLTLWFANFAESLAQGRGKAQAAALKVMRSGVIAHKQQQDGSLQDVEASSLQKDDIIVCTAGEMIPGDGEIIEGIASVDESAITGESAPVIRESGGDRSSVTGGTRILSDKLVIRISANAGESFLDRMIALVEGAVRQKTPNEIALHILLVGLTFIFLLAAATLIPIATYHHVYLRIMPIVALLVCLVPTTIGGLLAAIGIAGMDRLMRKNVVAKSGRAVEAAGDVDVLLLDKTGTITYGNRMADALLPAPNVPLNTLARAALLSSLADETPEGRSIVTWVQRAYPQESTDLPSTFTAIPFTAQTRISGVEFEQNVYQKGAGDAVRRLIQQQQGDFPKAVDQHIQAVASSGGTPLVVIQNHQVLGVIHLKDVVKTGIKERFGRFRAMGIRTVMVTGDNPATAKAIAAEAGVDDFIAEATPEAKLKLIMQAQDQGNLVAMTGDGTNDAPALAQADVGVAMNSGTQAAKEAGNMMDLDSDPTKLLEVVEVGKQLLMTRGALTTFSLANDVAKYFAILPALFIEAFPQLKILDVLKLYSPRTAILSAVIFNALIIVVLIPLALRGVSYRPLGAARLLFRSLTIYGLGGVIMPFVGIKLIDWLLGGLCRFQGVL